MRIKFKKDVRKDLEILREKLRRMSLLSDKERDTRREKALINFGFFAKTYFPHYLELPLSKLHEYFFKILPKTLTDKLYKHILTAAPRGFTKTTYVAKIFPLWCIIKRCKRNIPIISDTLETAAQDLEAIKIELEENPRLASDFPEIAGIGSVWQTLEIITKNRVRIKAYGSGKRIRGAAYGNYRPDLIIIDDLENDENVRSKDQRDKLHKWFERVVMFLGPPDDSAIVIYIGTILHYDSVFVRVSKRADFVYKKFKALIQYPENMDLWEKWEEIYRKNRKLALSYYQKHRRRMEKGAVVLWRAAKPLYSLMEARANSRRAFNSELQNEPLEEEDMLFGDLQFYDSLPSRLIYFGACDPALGHSTSDYTAIIILGRDVEGICYVIEADIARYKPKKAIQRIIMWQRKYNCMRWAIEEIAFQEFFKDSLIEEGAKKSIPVPAIGVKSRINKNLRIESLEPHVSNGMILFTPNHTMLLDQLREYSMGSYDDGPDALQMVFTIAHSTSGRVEYEGARRTCYFKKGAY